MILLIFDVFLSNAKFFMRQLHSDHDGTHTGRNVNWNVWHLPVDLHLCCTKCSSLLLSKGEMLSRAPLPQAAPCSGSHDLVMVLRSIPQECIPGMISTKNIEINKHKQPEDGFECLANRPHIDLRPANHSTMGRWICAWFT